MCANYVENDVCIHNQQTIVITSDKDSLKKQMKKKKTELNRYIRRFALLSFSQVYADSRLILPSSFTIHSSIHSFIHSFIHYLIRCVFRLLTFFFFFLVFWLHLHTQQTDAQ